MWLKWRHSDLNGCWNKLETSKLAEFRFWRTPSCQLSLKFNHSNIKLFFFMLWNLAASKINRVTALKRNSLQLGRRMMEILMPKNASFKGPRRKSLLIIWITAGSMQKVCVCKCVCVCVCVCVRVHVSTVNRHWSQFGETDFLYNSALFKHFSTGLSKRSRSKNSNRKIPLNIHVIEKTCREWEWERGFRISTHTSTYAWWHFSCPHSRCKEAWSSWVSMSCWFLMSQVFLGGSEQKYLKKANSKVFLNGLYSSDFQILYLGLCLHPQLIKI